MKKIFTLLIAGMLIGSLVPSVSHGTPEYEQEPAGGISQNIARPLIWVGMPLITAGVIASAILAIAPRGERFALLADHLKTNPQAFLICTFVLGTFGAMELCHELGLN